MSLKCYFFKKNAQSSIDPNISQIEQGGWIGPGWSGFLKDDQLGLQALQGVDSEKHDAENRADEVPVPEAKEDPKAGSPLADLGREVDRFFAACEIAKQAAEDASTIEREQGQQVE